MSMGKFGPTAPNFCYAFWAESGLLKGSELGSKIINSARNEVRPPHQLQPLEAFP